MKSKGIIEALIKVAAIYLFATGFHINVEDYIESILNDSFGIVEGLIYLTLAFTLIASLSVALWYLAPKLAGVISKDGNIDRAFNVDGDQILNVGIKLIFIQILFYATINLMSDIYFRLIPNSYFSTSNFFDNIVDFPYNLAKNLTSIAFSVIMIFKTKGTIGFMKRIEVRGKSENHGETANKSL